MFDKWGFIDAQGQTVIKCKYGDLREFYDGLAAFRWTNSPDEHIGYINKEGTIEIQPRFDGAANFSEGMAAVRIVDLFGEKWGFINTSGQIVIKPQYNWVFPFSENLAAVDAGTETYPRWGFIDKAGNMIINPRFGYVNSSFHNGYADVQTIKRVNGLVNIHGQFTPYPPKAGWVGYYSFTSRKVGYLDQNGNWAILPRFMEAGVYSEGVAPVRSYISPWKWGYIDLKGNVIISPQFDDAAAFKNSRAAVWLNGRQGTIDHKGRFITDKVVKKGKILALNSTDQRMVNLLLTAIKTGYKTNNGGNEYIAISFDQIAVVSTKETEAIIKELRQQSSNVFENDGNQINYINNPNNRGTVIGCSFDSYNGTSAVVWVSYSYFQGTTWKIHSCRYEAALVNGIWRLSPLAIP
ncbi:MAG: WG repeat-containing protein [Acidobacteriota bacterium]